MAVQNSINLKDSGLASHDGSGVFTGRTITAGANVSITDGDGVSGEPTVSVPMFMINDPQYASIKGVQSTTHSAGLVAGGVISNNGDGTVSVAQGDGLVKSSDSDVADLYSCDWIANSSVSLTDNSINYIYMSFVDTVTDPAVAVSTSKPSDLNTNILLGTVYRSGVENHITLSSSYNITNHIKKIIDRFQDTEYFSHASGAALSATGTRNIANTVGVFWNGLNKIETIAQDTSGASPDNNHTFEYFYYNGSTWITHEEAVAAVTFTGAGLNDATSGGTFVGSHTIRIHVEIDATGTPDTFEWSYKGNDGVTTITTSGVAITGSAQTLVDGATITFAATTGHTLADAWDFDCTLSAQIDNTQYNDITSGLVTLANNKYGVHWVYIDVHGHLSVLFGQGDYSLAEALEVEPPSSLPPEFETHVRLTGKILIQKSAAAFYSIENNYGSTFAGSVISDHGNLAGLADDDHLQYLLADGTRALAGAWDMDNQNVTNVDIDSGAIDGTTVGSTTTAAGAFSTVGVGTTAVPHGSVGYGLVALEGANSNAAGPHMQFTTATNDYPLLQVLPWSHDNVNIYFDGYRDATGQKSSSSNGNFRIKKGSNALTIAGETGIAAGSAATFVDIWNITADGEVTKPLQPWFLGVRSSANNVTGDGTAYVLVANTTVKDVGSNESSGTFTSPITGAYSLTLDVVFEGISSTMTYAYARIVTSNRTYDEYRLLSDGASSFGGITAAVNGDLDSADTVTWDFRVFGGAKAADLNTSRMSVYLLG